MGRRDIILPCAALNVNLPLPRTVWHVKDEEPYATRKRVQDMFRVPYFMKDHPVGGILNSPPLNESMEFWLSPAGAGAYGELGRKRWGWGWGWGEVSREKEGWEGESEGERERERERDREGETETERERERERQTDTHTHTQREKGETKNTTER